MMKNSIFYRIDLNDLEALFNYFVKEGYLNIGAKVKDEAIMCGEIEKFTQLPEGYYEILERGKYSLIQKSDKSLFHYTLGPQSFKPFLHPERSLLWSADLDNGEISINKNHLKSQKKVFWGIRSCDLHSILTLDRVFLKQDYKNPLYEQLRTDIFFIAVNCTRPSNNCFCSFMNTGPKATVENGMILTEVFSEKEHYFLCEVKNEKAIEISKQLSFQKASESDIVKAEELMFESEKMMKNGLDMKAAKKIISDNLESTHWQDVEARCLACANCTLVCPTCFCTTTEDITDLDGKHTGRWQKWDSCFNGDYSYIHGGIVRKSIKSRYRQWISHKLSTWYDQFDMSGCVGCGRCITWCPVGIDIRQEIKALQNHQNDKHKEKIN